VILNMANTVEARTSTVKRSTARLLTTATLLGLLLWTGAALGAAHTISAAIQTFVGYGDLLTLVAPQESGIAVPGTFDVRGQSCCSTVLVRAAREDDPAKSANMIIDVGADGGFAGTVWLLDGPGRYIIDVAALPQGETVYRVACRLVVDNELPATPLAPRTYPGYGSDLEIHSPFGPSSRVSDSMTIIGKSAFAVARARIVNEKTGEARDYSANTSPNGDFSITVPFDVGEGECHISVASRLSGPQTYNVAAKYCVIVEPAPIDMVQPAYRSGTVLAYDRYLIKGFANADGARVDVERNGKTATVLNKTQAGPFEAWIDPPTAHEECRVTVSSFHRSGNQYIPRRQYVVVRVPRIPAPADSEKKEIQWDAPQIRSLAVSLTQGIKDPYDKLRAIHDWVASNLVYDVRAAASGDLGRTDAVAAILRGGSVCQGYANATAALALAAGFRARVVSGEAVQDGIRESHAWNEVEVNGRIVLLDTTWDAGHVKDGRFVRRPAAVWFDSSPEEYLQNHRGGLILP
jgi:hypothetical protein